MPGRRRFRGEKSVEAGLPEIDEGLQPEDGLAASPARDRDTSVSSPTSLAQSTLPTWRLVLWLALPALAQQSLLLIVTLSDRYLAGHVDGTLEGLTVSGPALQAAHTTAAYLGWFITSYTVLVSVGSTALVARFIGAGDRGAAVRVT